MAGLVPASNVVEAWTSVDHALAWCSCAENVWTSVAEQFGDAGLKNLMIIAAIEASAVSEALANAQVNAAGLTPIQKATVTLLLNAIRSKFGAGPLVLAPAMPQQAGAAMASVTPDHIEQMISVATQPRTVNKVKLAQVVDQGSEVETILLDTTMLAAVRQRFVDSESDRPMENEEVTDAQLSALHAKVFTLGQAPFVDMGVWGPYGDRLARAMKFVSQQPDGAGGFRAVEMAGASNLTAWNSAWRIFRTAAIMLNIA